MDDSPIDVLVVGAVGVDTLVYPPGEWRWESAADGTLAEIRRTVAHGGGYAARGYAALGHRTGFLGHVGDDAEGQLVRDVFERDTIDAAGLVTSGRTAHSVNVVESGGRRHYFYDPRLDDVDPPPADLIAAAVGRARLIHVNIPNWTRSTLHTAHERGVTVLVDVQDAAGPDDEYRREFVEHADLLFASGAHLADPAGYARWALHVGRASVVVMGLGARGCLVAPRGAAHWIEPPVDLPPDPVTGEPPPVLDTNGAGDSLAVGIGSALVLDHLPLQDAVRRGLHCARWCCTLRGTSDGLLTRERLTVS